MGKGEDGIIQGILAYITTDESRYLGGDPFALLVKDEEELVKVSEIIAEVFMADIVQISSGDCLVVKS
jgi:hypothetical protein